MRISDWSSGVCSSDLTIDMVLPSTVMSSEVDLLGLFEMPYIVKDREHMKRIEKEIFWPKLAPAAEKKGLTILAVWENGYRHIRSEEHTSELQSLMRLSYDVFCLKKKT